MSNIKRRIEKAEGKVQLIEKELADKRAKLLEIQRLEGQNSLRAALLRLELEYGQPFTLVDVVAMVAGRQTKDGHRV